MLLRKPFLNPRQLIFIALASLFSSTACYASTLQTLSIYGSNTIGARLAPALAEGFLQSQGFAYVHVQSNPETLQHTITAGTDPLQLRVRIDIHAQGSSTGFSALHERSANIAASSRPIKDQEVKLLNALGDMRNKHAEHVLAIDGLAIIVHNNSPVNALDANQIAAIFSGEINDWSMLGAPPGPINIYARDNNSGTWDTFKELILSPSDKTLSNNAKRFESSEKLSDTVSKDPHGIGFIGLPYVRQAKALAVSAGNAIAMQPSSDLIATEDYPLSRRLYLYSSEHEDNLLAQNLLAFAHSDAGQRLVESNGFISQIVSAMPVSVAEGMPQRYQQLAREAQRLSVNFRFKEGSSQLDNKAERDIERVLAYLRKHNKTENKLVLVGFGDSKSDPQRALLLSKLRAMAVRRQLHNKEIIFREIFGIGDAMPVANNLLDQGRIKNRRVELWVY
ncbi:MAG: phosphate ABC transporter substrate-binding/OmpA family protein [Pseudomonas sp.]|jgi:phosphate transport system substrate-binding protein|nr:phosphate ABC transporter substrate-binding/OmpA family protein [Pseudomonas sp.]